MKTMKHNLRNLVLGLVGALFLATAFTSAFGHMTVSLTPPPRLPSATCFCVVSKDDLTNKTSRSGVCLDLTSTVNKTYTGINPQNDSNQTDCNTRCTAAAAALSAAQKQAIATCACAAGASNGTAIRAFSAVGTKEYKTAQQVGVLINTPQITKTVCTCPASWTCNGCSPQVTGGITTDGKCKKVACQANTIPPFPPNGTPIGSWGFTWGNAFIAWGTTANGGAPNCVTSVVSPAQCKLQ